MKKRTIIIIIIIVIIILLLAIAGYFILKQNNFSFSSFNFGSLEGIGKSGNAFEEAKLNPFTNTTG